MYILLSLVLVAAGALMLASPQTVFRLTESWKNNAPGEPSGLYLLSTRVGGALCLAVGAAGVLLLLFL